jgi:short-subunit dehydrogenase
MQNKVLIIGGSSGLGKRLAEIYAAEGYQAGIIARRELLLKEIQKQFPNQIHIAKADINDIDIAEKLNKIINELGGIDICIITASVVEFNYELCIAPEIKTVDTNISGYIKVLNFLWHYFKQKGGGHIAGVTSIAGARGNKIVPAYHASKAFQSIYLESLRVKAGYEKNNIIITELIPGYIDTAMGKGNRLFWVASLDKAAKQVKRAIEKRKQRAFITKRWWLIYQLYRFLPTFIYSRIVNSKISFQKKDPVS